MLKGELKTKLIKAKRVHHWFQDLVLWFQLLRIRIGGALSGQLIMYGELSIRKLDPKMGKRENHGVVCRRAVTDTGVAAMVDDWDDDSKDITLFNQHDSGTGVTGANQTDTALQTPCGESRDAGAKTQPLAYQIRSVATHTYAGPFAITEHGIFDNAAGGVLWDRHTFGAINVGSGDGIEFTYTLTITAGG